MNMLIIAGPTASGKTALSLKLAKLLNGEIVAADSRTIYKGMDIGTAKPTSEEQKNIRHHCLNLVEPNQEFTVADFVKFAKDSIEQIRADGKLPIIVGGSGLFIDSLVYEYSFVKPNLKLRDKYQNYNVERLQEEIIRIGLNLPENRLNKRHLLSTLERQGAKSSKRNLPKGTLYIGIRPAKEVLFNNITNRAGQMIDLGVVEEAKELFDKYDIDCRAFNGGIYKLIPVYLSKEISLQNLIAECISSDKKLAKKQLTWFKRNQDIHWFNDIDLAYNWLASQ